MTEATERHWRVGAIEDGDLFDVSKVASEVGIPYPVAVTRVVWMSCVRIREWMKGIQDEEVRLWNLMDSLRMASEETDEMSFLFPVWVKNMKGAPPGVLFLTARYELDEDGQLVITIFS